MSGAALERVFREASGRIVGALAARFRNLALAEDVFSEACARALEDWSAKSVPTDPAAWLYQVAARAALDGLRRRRTHARFECQLSADFDTDPADLDDEAVIPDERLRLIFICCHPAVGVDARAALTLRLVCGLSTLEIARAFLVSEATMAQRLTRAKSKIADAGVPFELPAPRFWPERLDAVLATIEIAYGKAHEDAAASGPHAHFAAGYLNRASALRPDAVRVIQAKIHAAWCSRRTLQSPPPWPQVMSLYDSLLTRRDDPIVRLNRLVAVAEVHGIEAALSELESLDGGLLRHFAPYHAVRADLLRRLGRAADARCAYDEALLRTSTHAERKWLTRQRGLVLEPQS